MMETKHTPKPWFYGEYSAAVEIEKLTKERDELLAALKEVWAVVKNVDYRSNENGPSVGQIVSPIIEKYHA